MQVLNHDTLLDAHMSHVGQYLKEAMKLHGEETVNNDLLEAIKAELISPIVITAWLSQVSSMQSVKSALFQDWSAFVRQAAIDRVGRFLCSEKWWAVWDDLGGLEGILNLFATLSVLEVRQFSWSIGDSYRHRDGDKTVAVTNLFNSLCPTLSPGASLENPDQRPLRTHYLQMLPACSGECVEKIIMQRSLFGYDSLTQRLLFSHTDLLQTLFLTESKAVRLAVPKIDYLWQGLSSGRTTADGLSASMDYALTFLRASGVAGKELDEKTMQVMPKLIASLTHRSIKKKSDKVVLEAVHLGVQYFKDHKTPFRKSPADCNDFLFDIVTVWGNNLHRKDTSSLPNQDFTTPLTEMLGITLRSSKILIEYSEILQRVPRKLRYRLLVLILLEMESINITDVAQLKNWKKDTIDVDVVELLDRRDAISLVDRLLSANPKGEIFSTTSGSAFNPPQVLTGKVLDCDILLVDLHDGDEEAVRLAEQKIRDRKELAARSREQPERAFYAKTVVIYATLSGSLSIFEEVMMWTKTFLRDPLTIKALFVPAIVANDKVVRLLAGTPDRDKPHVSGSVMSSLKDRITEANNTLRSMTKIILEAQREPWFDIQYWRGILKLFPLVIDRRAMFTTWLEKQPGHSESKVFETVWSDTLKLVIEVEQKGLEIGQEEIDVNRQGGLLSLVNMKHKTLSGTYLQFRDDVAKTRDKLWQQYRPSQNPAVAEIGRPFPKGLPIQAFVNNTNFLAGWNPQTARYVASRAEIILFMNIRDAIASIPEDKQITEAIGPFIDSLYTAAAVHVLQDADLKKRDERMQSVWSYWTDILRQNKSMSERDAHAFLYQHLQPWTILPDAKNMKYDLNEQVFPKRPFGSGTSEAIEWDPAFEALPITEDRVFSVTILDCFMKTNLDSSKPINAPFVLPAAWKAAYKNTAILDASRERRGGRSTHFSGIAAEGLVLAALLTLDTTSKTKSRHLASAFPLSEKVRYPSVFLDSNFLERKDVTQENALKVLTELIVGVPPTLLAGMTKTYLDSLHELADSKQLPQMEKTAYKLLKLLARSDKPELATNLIIDTIIDRPEASSWHRQLLTVRFLRRLPKKVLEEMVSKFSKAIVAKLEQDTANVAQADETGRKRSIKITTVKMLAQLLQASDYVSPVLAIDTLIQLFQKTTHIDVRTAAIEGLLQLLPRDKTSITKELLEAILSALELAIPVAGAFNERQPLTKKKWQSLEASSTVPDMFSPLASQEPPIIAALLRPKLSDSIEKQFFNRIILPTIDLSRKNNARALRIVLKKSDFDPDLAPNVIPFKLVIATKLLNNYHKYLPQSFFKDVQALTLSNIEPSQSIADISRKMKETNASLNSAEARIWFTYFDMGPDIIRQVDIIPRLLTKSLPEEEPARSFISVDLVQNAVCAQATALLKTGDDPTFSLWYHFENLLAPSSSSSYAAVVFSKEWRHCVGPVVERIIKEIDEMRTPDWQKNAHRQPVVLPSSLRLKTLMLEYPTPSNDSLSQSKLEHFADILFKFLVDTVKYDPPTIYEPIHAVMEAAKKVRHKYYTRLLCCLGAVCEQNLRRGSSTFVSAFFINAITRKLSPRLETDMDDDTRERVKQVVRKWQDSEIEEVRMQGLRLGKTVFASAG